MLEAENLNITTITENKNLKTGSLVNKLGIKNIEHDDYKITKETYETVSIYHFPGYNEYDDFTIVVAKNNKDSITEANKLANNLLKMNEPVYLFGVILCDNDQKLPACKTIINQFSSICHNACLLTEEQLPYLLSIFFSEGAKGIHSIPTNWLNDFTYHDIFMLKVISCKNKASFNKNLSNILKRDPTKARKIVIGLEKEDDLSLSELGNYNSIIKELYNSFPEDFSLKFGVSISDSYADIIIIEQMKNNTKDNYKQDNFLIKNGKLISYFGNSKNVTIPNNIKIIGKKAFMDNPLIEKITLPENCKIIEEHAFQNCYNLKSINIPSSVEEIKWEAFEDCKNLDNITLPSSMTKIEDYLFCGCTKLKHIKIPNEILNIGRFAFCGCALEYFNFPSKIQNIRWGTFENCIQLKQVIFNKDLKTIERDAFAGCSKLSNITLPKHISYINKDAFYLCTSLKNTSFKF